MIFTAVLLYLFLLLSICLHIMHVLHAKHVVSSIRQNGKAWSRDDTVLPFVYHIHGLASQLIPQVLMRKSSLFTITFFHSFVEELASRLVYSV